MRQPIDQFEATLKTGGYNLTKPRRIVFEALLDKEPQTIAQVVGACASIDRASVYRAIALFERLGIVQRLQIGWKYKLELSDNFHHHHHHLSCLKCGDIIPLEEDVALEKMLVQAAASKSFKISGHQIEIQGFCSQCS